MDNENRPAPLPEDYFGDGENYEIPHIECPECASNDVNWTGGDDVVNLGNRPLWTRVDWWFCNDCGHKWSESYDHE